MVHWRLNFRGIYEATSKKKNNQREGKGRGEGGERGRGTEGRDESKRMGEGEKEGEERTWKDRVERRKGGWEEKV